MIKKMNFFLFRCCQEVKCKELEFDIDISSNITNSSNESIDQIINKIKENLKTKLCLFTIYSNANELIPFNELKKEKKISEILNIKYFEMYNKVTDPISQSFIKKFSLSGFAVLCLILTLEENNIKLVDLLKNDEITTKNLKKILLIYQYMLYKPPDEPLENDNNATNITFRFIDENQNFNRRYDKRVKVKELYHLIKSKNPGLQFRLFRVSPSQELKNPYNSLEQENLYPNGIVQIIC